MSHSRPAFIAAMLALLAGPVPSPAAAGDTGAVELEAVQLATAPGDESNQWPAGALSSGPFAKGSRLVTAYGSTTFLDDDHGNMHSAHLGAHYYVEDDLSVGIKGMFSRVESVTDDDGIAGGFDLMLRWHFVSEPDWSVYFDAGLGFQQADTNFPSDSHHNFRTQLGFGLTWQAFEQAHLMTGFHYLHVSNASTTEGNDGGDWAEPYLGVMIPF